jgi:hypothetical protein
MVHFLVLALHVGAAVVQSVAAEASSPYQNLRVHVVSVIKYSVVPPVIVGVVSAQETVTTGDAPDLWPPLALKFSVISPLAVVITTAPLEADQSPDVTSTSIVGLLVAVAMFVFTIPVMAPNFTVLPMATFASMVPCMVKVMVTL